MTSSDRGLAPPPVRAFQSILFERVQDGIDGTDQEPDVLRRPPPGPAVGVAYQRARRLPAGTVLLPTAARSRGGALPPPCAERPDGGTGARGRARVRKRDASDAQAPRAPREAAPRPPEAAMVRRSGRNVLPRRGWFPRSARRPRAALAGILGAARIPHEVRRVRQVRFAHRGNAGDGGRARLREIRGPHQRQPRTRDPRRGRGGHERAGRADLRQVQAGGGHGLSGEAPGLGRHESRGGADPRSRGQAAPRDLRQARAVLAAKRATTSTERSGHSTARCSSTSRTWSTSSR